MSARDGHVLPGTDAEIRLRVDRFELMTRVLGCESDLARAYLIGVDPRTISRARQGVIGEVFMAKLVTALRRNRPRLAELGLEPTLDDLFEVVELASDKAA
jgi:hypothetical protein